MDNKKSNTVVTNSIGKLRCIDYESLKKNNFVLLMTNSPRDVGTNVDDYYECSSRPLKPNEEISYFISHSWTDSGKLKKREVTTYS